PVVLADTADLNSIGHLPTPWSAADPMSTVTKNVGAVRPARHLNRLCSAPSEQWKGFHGC
ncbi:MAG TPA: hypothetical protein VLN58_05645, partial [Verrucomicrobiae bacterium]|nr:hypothetical protein [Verrucomicrobiae bacterium]